MKKVLIAGGLGFIGINLSLMLREIGYDVVIIDRCHKNSGFNELHIEYARKIGCSVITDSISNIGNYISELKSTECIINLAALISHSDSMHDPLTDIENNTIEHIKFLKVITDRMKGTRIIYASTRQIYGKQETLPVDENTCVNPVDINGINKYAAELYHRVFSNVNDMNLLVMRITNVYGPAMHIRDRRLSFIGWFMNRVLQGENIEIYGSGEQKRDMLFIDDLNRSFIGAVESDYRGILNIGGAEAFSLNDIAAACRNLNPLSGIVKVPFPAESIKIDIGSYASSSKKAGRILNHNPETSLEKGLLNTYEYFKQRMEAYL